MKKQSLYLECSSGISGDMVVAALIDLGIDRAVLTEVLESVPAAGFQIEIKDVEKSGIRCCDFDVVLDQDNHDHDMDYLYGHDRGEADLHDTRHVGHPHSHEHVHDHENAHDHGHEHAHDHDHGTHDHEHRNIGDVTRVIEGSSASGRSKELAKRIFDIIADAEAKAHGIPKDQVHFHEVGAIDSIVDVLAAAVCIDQLGVSDVVIPCINEGQGSVRCQHGILPVPVPAVVNIAQAHGLTLRIMSRRGEFITPTGAAIAAAIKTGDRLPDSFRILKAGLGTGKRDYEPPSFLRAMLIEHEA